MYVTNAPVPQTPVIIIYAPPLHANASAASNVERSEYVWWEVCVSLPQRNGSGSSTRRYSRAGPPVGSNCKSPACLPIRLDHLQLNSKSKVIRERDKFFTSDNHLVDYGGTWDRLPSTHRTKAQIRVVGTSRPDTQLREPKHAISLFNQKKQADRILTRMKLLAFSRNHK